MLDKFENTNGTKDGKWSFDEFDAYLNWARKEYLGNTQLEASIASIVANSDVTKREEFNKIDTDNNTLVDVQELAARYPFFTLMLSEKWSGIVPTNGANRVDVQKGKRFLAMSVFTNLYTQFSSILFM